MTARFVFITAVTVSPAVTALAGVITTTVFEEAAESVPVPAAPEKIAEPNVHVIVSPAVSAVVLTYVIVLLATRAPALRLVGVDVAAPAVVAAVTVYAPLTGSVSAEETQLTPTTVLEAKLTSRLVEITVERMPSFATTPGVIVAIVPLPEMTTVPTLAVVVAPSPVKIFLSNVHVIVSTLSSAPVELAVKLIVFVDTRAPAAIVFGVDDADAPAEETVYDVASKSVAVSWVETHEISFTPAAPFTARFEVSVKAVAPAATVFPTGTVIVRTLPTDAAVTSSALPGTTAMSTAAFVENGVS
jgi:hypothetical protein